jgi:hypothetical protein
MVLVSEWDEVVPPAMGREIFGELRVSRVGKLGLVLYSWECCADRTSSCFPPHAGLFYPRVTSAFTGSMRRASSPPLNCLSHGSMFPRTIRGVGDLARIAAIDNHSGLAFPVDASSVLTTCPCLWPKCIQYSVCLIHYEKSARTQRLYDSLGSCCMHIGPSR